MMRPPRLRSGRRRGCLLAAVLLAACASPGVAVHERLDPQTAVTVAFNNTPLVLYRDSPSQAAFARNYVYLGPIEVNQSGTYRYYLWLGIWNTMQTTSPSEHPDGFESIVLFADGEPLSLDISGWTPEAIGTSEPVYVKPVGGAADAYYRVTADQIRLLAEANDIRLQTSGSPVREFHLWDAQKSARNELAEFLQRAAGR